MKHDITDNLIRLINKLHIDIQARDEQILHLKQQIEAKPVIEETSLRVETPPVIYHRKKEKHIPNQPPTVKSKNGNTALDSRGQPIRIGDVVHWKTPSKFNTKGGVVTKLTAKTVTAFDKSQNIHTWKAHHNCTVIKNQHERKQQGK